MSKNWIEKELIYTISLFLFIVAFIFGNYIILINGNPDLYFYDCQEHLSNADDNYRLMKKRGPFANFFAPISYFYPPLVYIVSSVFFFVFGKSVMTAILSQAVFIFILAFSIYFITRELFEPKIALLGAVFALSVPYVGFHCRIYHLDLPLAAAVAFAFFCLLKSGHLTKPRWTVAFFVAVGLGFLIKMHFVLYITGPLVFALVMKTRQSKGKIDTKRNVLSILLPLPFFVLSAITAYLVGKALTGRLNWHYSFTNLSIWLVSILPVAGCYFVWKKFLFSERWKHYVIGALTGWAVLLIYYGPGMELIYKSARLKAVEGAIKIGFSRFLSFIPLDTLGIPLTLLATVGIVFLFVNKEFRSKTGMIQAGLFSGLVILALFPTKTPPYFLPLIPFAVVLGVSWIGYVQKPALKKTVLAVSVYFLLAGWLGIFYSGSFVFGWLKSLQWNCFTRKRFVFMSEKSRRPDFRPSDVADCVHLLSSNRRAVIVNVSRFNNPSVAMVNGIIIHARYSYGDRYFNVPGLDQAPGMELDGSKGLRRNLEVFRFYFMTRTPQEKNVFSYDCFLVVNVRDSGMYVLVPERFRNKMRQSGLDYRPDVHITVNSVDLNSETKVKTDVIRIPVRELKRAP